MKDDGFRPINRADILAKVQEMKIGYTRVKALRVKRFGYIDYASVGGSGRPASLSPTDRIVSEKEYSLQEAPSTSASKLYEIL